ncbi:MAG: hypothetical protein HRT45_04030 [Bdellovibrionales bacterium]|nr:hypothetical protein [Bdellovibrionales bacterium]
MALIIVLPLACAPKEVTTTGNPMRLSIQGTEPNSLSDSSFSTDGESSASSKLRSLRKSDLNGLSTATIDLIDSSGSTVGSLTLTDARLVLLNIEFEEDNDGVEDDEVEYSDMYVVDLLNDTTTPEIPEIDLDEGDYFELVFETTAIDSSDVDRNGNSLIEASDPLNGHSLYLEGTYTGPSASSAQTDIPFKVALDIETEFELTGSSDTSLGFKIDGEDLGSVTDIIIAFRLNKWFRYNDDETNDTPVDPSQFVVSSGEIDIDPSTGGANGELAEVIFYNMLESADYGEDLDDDGELDIDEDDDPDDEDDEDE